MKQDYKHKSNITDDATVYITKEDVIGQSPKNSGFSMEVDAIPYQNNVNEQTYNYNSKEVAIDEVAHDNNEMKLNSKEVDELEQLKNLEENRKRLKERLLDFQFRETRTPDNVTWKHDGDKFKCIVEIHFPSNSIGYEQQELIDGAWVMVRARIMAPLQELFDIGREAYFVSLNTRHLNKKWNASQTNIIPGTNGDTPLEDIDE